MPTLPIPPHLYVQIYNTLQIVIVVFIYKFEPDVMKLGESILWMGVMNRMGFVFEWRGRGVGAALV